MTEIPALPRLLPSGDRAITVEYSRDIDDAANARVLSLDRALARAPGRLFRVRLARDSRRASQD